MNLKKLVIILISILGLSFVLNIYQWNRISQLSDFKKQQTRNIERVLTQEIADLTKIIQRDDPLNERTSLYRSKIKSLHTINELLSLKANIDGPKTIFHLDDYIEVNGVLSSSKKQRTKVAEQIRENVNENIREGDGILYRLDRGL